MTTNTRWLAVAALLIGGGLAFGGEGSPPPSEKQLKELVERLASPNPKPITGDEDDSVAPDYRLPKGFDRAKQKRVREAIEELRELGTKAFPALIERWDDKRYCVTTFHRLSEYSHNSTVGAICRKTIFDQLQPYSLWPLTDEDPRGLPKRPRYPEKFLGSKKDAQQWWDKHKDKTIFQIQLEVIDWVIAEEAKRPRDYSEKERQFLRDVRAMLVKIATPMPPGNYDWVQVEF